MNQIISEEPTTLEKQFIVVQHADLKAQHAAALNAEDIAFRMALDLEQQIKEIEAQPWWKEMEDAR